MKEDNFSDQEVEYLLDLLKDSAEKLRERSETWYRLRTQAQTVLLLGVTPMALVGVYGLWVSLTGQVAINTIGLMLGLVTIFLISTVLVRMQIIRRANLESDNVARLRGVVERLVRRGSQMEDHGSIAFTHRIAFDLRLGEAEAILKQSAVPARYSELELSLARSQERFDEKYTELAKSRETFWTLLRHAYSKFSEDHPNAPQPLEALIRAAGVPPDLFPRDGRDLRLWSAENASTLGPDQRLLWAFASLIYVPRENRSGKVTDYSIIPTPEAESFHNARGDLARFWNTWVLSLTMEYLCERYRAATDQLIMLSWLEIALVQWTQDQGEGKTALFRLVQELNRKQDKDMS
jgi:hypothetical protein